MAQPFSAVRRTFSPPPSGRGLKVRAAGENACATGQWPLGTRYSVLEHRFLLQANRMTDHLRMSDHPSEEQDGHQRRNNRDMRIYSQLTPTGGYPARRGVRPLFPLFRALAPGLYTRRSTGLFCASRDSGANRAWPTGQCPETLRASCHRRRFPRLFKEGARGWFASPKF